MQKLAIIGSGISGMGAAYLLQDKYDITVFEKNAYIGGHSNTVTFDYDSEELAVDTGFIVFNHLTYPNLLKLFNELSVPTRKSDMSFGINSGAIEYSSKSVFAQKKNLLNPKFLRMVYDIVKFNKASLKILNKKSEISLGDFIKELGMGEYFENKYLLPMAGAIWSCPTATMMEYPAYEFISFFKNHGLLQVKNHPEWFTVEGGSREYVKLLTANFKDKIKLNCGVTKVEKTGDKIIVEADKEYEFDKVIFASHADETLSMIKNPTAQQQDILQNFRYQKNTAILHTDESLMPKNKKAWASWIYTGSDNNEICVTYWMNNLQQFLPANKSVFVTLNAPAGKIAKDKIVKQFNYTHPIFDEKAVAAQKQIHEIQGENNMYFCGAYQANGFHEDGFASAVRVAKLLGSNW